MATLRLDILPPAQRALWDDLQEVPSSFTLYGGTAIALQLGHRESVDFDFFMFESFDTRKLYDELPFLDGAQILQQQKDALTCLVTRPHPVKVSFVGLPKLRCLREPWVTAEGLKIASLLDLAGMKVAVVQQRAEAKDYLDIDALLQHGISLSDALAAAVWIYGRSFNPQISLKALCYFGEGDLARLPSDLQDRLARAVAEVDLGTLPALQGSS